MVEGLVGTTNLPPACATRKKVIHLTTMLWSVGAVRVRRDGREHFDADIVVRGSAVSDGDVPEVFE